MRIKNYLNYFLMFILTLSISNFLTSCEDEESTEKTELTKYKWYSENTDYLLYGKDDLNLSIQTDRIWLYFLANGTGIMSCRTTDKDTYFGTSRDEIAYRFNYTVSGGKVNLSFKDSNLNRTLTHNKDFLTDSENSVSYKALSFTSSELDHAKELADEQEFQESINHNQIQSLDAFIGFGNNLQPIKFTSDYLWSVSFSCRMPKDSQRRGITLAGLVIYIDNGTITNKTGYDKESECNVKVTTLDGKNAYYFEHTVYYNEETQCGASMNVYSSSGSALKIHSAYRYYDNVSKKYFTSPSKEYVLTGEGIDASGDDNNNGDNTGENGSTENGSENNTGNDDTASTTGKNNGHDWVDLGLSVRWATCNVGASSAEKYGDYFAWGETTPKGYDDDDSWSVYQLCNGSENTLTKYCTDSGLGKVDNKTILDLNDDAAHVNWKGDWRMPTKAEFDELVNKCTWKWQSQNGKNGYKITSKKNKNSIFLPTEYTGYAFSSGKSGSYWSSSIYNNSFPNYASLLSFSEGNIAPNNRDFRCRLHAIRPVCSN